METVVSMARGVESSVAEYQMQAETWEEVEEAMTARLLARVLAAMAEGAPMLDTTTKQKVQRVAMMGAGSTEMLAEPISMGMEMEAAALASMTAEFQRMGRPKPALAMSLLETEPYATCRTPLLPEAWLLAGATTKP